MSLDPVLVHQLFAAAVAIVALALLLDVADIARLRAAEFLPGAALVLIGAFLGLDPWLFHGGSFGAEGQQHVWQGALMFVAGGLEVYRVSSAPNHRLLILILPVVLAAMGVGFLAHSQHGAGDVVLQLAQHRIMGATLLFASALKLAEVCRVGRGTWASAGWLVALLTLAIQLALYVERSGASAAHH